MTIQDIKKTIDQNSCFFGLFNNSVIADEPELIPTQAIDYVKQIHGTVSQSIDLSEKSQGYLVNTLLSIINNIAHFIKFYFFYYVYEFNY